MIKSNELKTTDPSSTQRPATPTVPIIYLLRKRLSIVEFKTIILSYDFPRENTGWRSSKAPLAFGAREILTAYVNNYFRNIKSAPTNGYNSLTLSERERLSQ